MRYVLLTVLLDRWFGQRIGLDVALGRVRSTFGLCTTLRRILKQTSSFACIRNSDLVFKLHVVSLTRVRNTYAILVPPMSSIPPT